MSFFVCCNEKTDKTISDVKTLYFEDAIEADLKLRKSVPEIIKLEASNEGLLSSIQKAFIDATNNRIFILSHFNLYFFDTSGKFITKLKSGRGPGEITLLSSFSANTEKQCISVVDNSRNLIEYDYNGNFIRKAESEDFYSMSISYKDDDHLFLYCNYVGKSEKYYVGNFSFLQQRILQKYVFSDHSPYPLSSNLILSSNFIKQSDDLYLVSPDIFGLFKFHDEDFKLLYQFDIGNKKIPDQMAKDLMLNSRTSFRGKAKEKNYIPHVLYVAFYNDYFLVGLDDNNNSCYAFVKNNPEKIYYKSNISKFLDLPDVPSLQLPIDNSENSIVFACYPLDFFKEEETIDEKTIQIGGRTVHIRIDDNPFLVYVN